VPHHPSPTIKIEPTPPSSLRVWARWIKICGIPLHKWTVDIHIYIMENMENPTINKYG
jgi:hypothetical protein